MRVIAVFVGVFMVCATFTAGAPIEAENSDLLSYENVRTENGYRFSYATKDGQAREEVGTIDPSTGALTVTGWYSYRTPDGAEYRVDFIADENGYRVVDQPTPINNAVLLSLVG
ncbi:larval cuticle protein 65Ag1-like [Anopheles maculipalpis]|uniref:larval cuticle protein 65Ag1-like n=1 Tax=Anopheles maculipalpis TaxID=1496333 RepID=UPI002159611D|nr:larval cuticle protein 65Ag1-like [Anopheles maculipalpis]